MSNLEKTLFNMKMTSKMLAREAAKKEKEQKDYDKRALQNVGKNDEKTKLFAGEAIRCRTVALQFTRLSLRMEAVSSRVETAIRMKTFTKQLGTVVNDMNTVLESMDPERIGKMMDKFEKQFENLDVGTATMEDSIDRTTASSMPDSEINTYLAQLQAVHAAELHKETMNSTGQVPTNLPQTLNSTSSSNERIANPVGGMAVPPAQQQQQNNNQNNNNNGGNMPMANSGGQDIADVLAARLAALKK